MQSFERSSRCFRRSSPWPLFLRLGGCPFIVSRPMARETCGRWVLVRDSREKSFCACRLIYLFRSKCKRPAMWACDCRGLNGYRKSRKITHTRGDEFQSKLSPKQGGRTQRKWRPQEDLFHRELSTEESLGICTLSTVDKVTLEKTNEGVCYLALLHSSKADIQ